MKQLKISKLTQNDRVPACTAQLIRDDVAGQSLVIESAGQAVLIKLSDLLEFIAAQEQTSGE